MRLRIDSNYPIHHVTCQISWWSGNDYALTFETIDPNTENEEFNIPGRVESIECWYNNKRYSHYSRRDDSTYVTYTFQKSYNDKNTYEWIKD